LCSFFKGKIKHLTDRIKSAGLKQCAISEITKAELVYGAAHSSNPYKNYHRLGTWLESVATIPIASQ